MSESQIPVKPAPLLGADNLEVYRDLLGLTEQEIEDLAERGAI